jgi:tocopherol cyclase
MNPIKKILTPSIYHGHNKKPPFFEGWYYKLISENQYYRFAVIPGIFLGPNGYSFVQVLDGSTGESDFFTFPVEQFHAEKGNFDIQIENNRFQLDRILLDIKTSEKTVQGEINFNGVNGWPVSIKSPGIMGWYAWVPRMECYHAVLGFDHKIIGTLQIDHRVLDFNNGRGYIEKDWGKSFPKGYVWMQSNHFQDQGVSLTASAAMIPWIGYEFRGFIVGLWIQGKLYRFATYTGANLTDFQISDHQVTMTLYDQNHILEIIATRNETGLLKGPTRVAMDMRVAESLTSTIHVRLTNSHKELLFEGSGLHAGLEVAGDIPRLLAG